MESFTMSDNRKSTLNDLRQFRLQKAVASQLNGHGSKTEDNLGIVPGKKRIRVIADSDSDNDAANTSKKVKIKLSVEDRENRFLSASKIAPEHDPMNIQDSLVRCNWDVSAAIRYLKDNYAPTYRLPQKSSSQQHHQNGSSKSNSKKKPTGNSDEEDDEDVGHPKEQVYDSDDSDTEMSNKMTAQRKDVFNFMNTAPQNELLGIKSCSEKKASAIISLRPFGNWADLRDKLERHRNLSADILNSCQDLLNKQSNIISIMSKCSKMVKKLEAAIATGAGITEQPSILSNSYKLAEYQLIGLNWLAVMYKQKMNGILADEMGLGKTIQVIAFLAYLKENNLAKGTHLIVVPSSTLDNWEVELRKWWPSLILEKYYGNQDERRNLRIRYAKEGFRGIDVLLTTYHMVASTPEERKMFRVSKLHYVIFDEAHMVKNMTTQRYAQLVTINAEMRILLTGTPLQNNLLELMSLLCFVMPSFFGKNVEDIRSLFKQKTQKGKDEGSSFEQNQVDQAKRIMQPFVLRRLKKDVLKDLPKKTEYIKKIPMSERQKTYYNELVEYYSNEKGVIKGNTEISGCAIMMEMRRLANHPLLMRHFFSDNDVKEISKRLAISPSYKKQNAQYIFEDLACLSDFQIYQICEKHELDDVTIPKNLLLDSGKFKELDNILPKLKEGGHRVLIFSQFTMMLDIIERYLDIREHSYFRLDGSTVVTERQEMIDQFNEDPEIFIFLLSTKAGGMGINLSAADTAIIHDIDFNPYNDKQAEDRCHRMGQTKPVSIYRFVSEGTIEEGMLMIAKDKLNLEKEINSEKEDVQEHKCMVRLLTMALGMDEKRAETLLSPTTASDSTKRGNDDEF